MLSHRLFVAQLRLPYYPACRNLPVQTLTDPAIYSVLSESPASEFRSRLVKCYSHRFILWSFHRSPLSASDNRATSLRHCLYFIIIYQAFSLCQVSVFPLHCGQSAPDPSHETRYPVRQTASGIPYPQLPVFPAADPALTVQ